MTFQTIRCEIDGKIATVTIHKPPVNALASDDYGELYETFYKLSKNESVLAVVLTAIGKKIFVGGSDVREFAVLNRTTGAMYTARNNGVRTYIYDFPKPIICAMNGSAFGGGVGLAICTDIRLCPPEASFSIGEINMGILGHTQNFAARCHNGTVRKMVYTGGRITAEEARLIGFIDEIVPNEKLMERAYQLAGEIASKSPLAIRYAKQCLNEAERHALAGMDFEAERIGWLWAAEDKTEAVTSFLEKRKPSFKGR